MTGEVDDLRDQQKMLSEDLSNAQMRWHALREEKLRASSVLLKFKKAEEDLVHFAEEKEQLILDQKVFIELPFICNMDPVNIL